MNLAANIETIMTRDLITVAFDKSCEELESLFERRSIHHILVEDNDAKLIGMISTEDLSRIQPFISSPHALRVHHIMTSKLVYLSSTDTVGDALDVLLDNRVRALPVVDKEGVAVGIVSPYDFLEWIETDSNSDSVSDED